MLIGDLSKKNSPELGTRDFPLVVDLDGTLLKIDTLHEGFLVLLFQRPQLACKALLTWLRRGRAAMKAEIAGYGLAGIELAPLNHDFLAWLQAEQARGRPLHLVSAANQEIVRQAAGRLGFFTSFAGSIDTVNLKSNNKARHIMARFPNGFSYAGNSADDLAVWREARSIVMVAAPSSVWRSVRALNRPIEAKFPSSSAN